MPGVILGKNIFNAESVITANDSSGFEGRVRDASTSVRFVSFGKATDTTLPVTLQIDFYKAGAREVVNFGGFAMLNHNINNMSIVTYNHDTTLAVVAYDQNTGAVGDGTYTNFDTGLNIPVTRLTITMNSTLPANNEKKVGELYLFGDQVSPGDLISYSVNSRQEVSELRMADGSIHRAYVGFGFLKSRTRKYEATAQVDYITQANLDKLILLKQYAKDIIWIPESVNNPSEVYKVHWSGPFTHHYTSKFKDAGWSVVFNMKEA